MPSETIPTEAAAPESPARYRAMRPDAVISLVLGVLSILTLLGWAFAIIPLTGIVLGWLALRRIREAPEEWTGLRCAQWGIWLSVGLWVVGYGWLAYVGTQEVPYGYKRINFDNLQPDPNNPAESMKELSEELDDKKVYIKGFMKPSRRQTGIKEFILANSIGNCPYCNPNPKPTEMIRVNLPGDMATIFTNNQIGVAGRLHIEAEAPGGLPYSLEVEYPIR